MKSIAICRELSHGSEVSLRPFQRLLFFYFWLYNPKAFTVLIPSYLSIQVSFLQIKQEKLAIHKSWSTKEQINTVRTKPVKHMEYLAVTAKTMAALKNRDSPGIIFLKWLAT